MNILSNKALTLVFSCLFASFGLHAAETTEMLPRDVNTRLLVKNQTDIKIEVKAQKLTRPGGTLVLSPNEVGYFDSVPPSIEVSMYGRHLGRVSRPVTLNIREEVDKLMKKKPAGYKNFDVVLSIKTKPVKAEGRLSWLGLRDIASKATGKEGLFGEWDFNIELESKELAQKSLGIIPEGKSAWDVFPGINFKKGSMPVLDYVKSTNPITIARYILGLSKDYPPAQLNRNYEHLSAIWKGNERVKSIIFRAWRILDEKDTKLNFKDLIEKEEKKRAQDKIDVAKKYSSDAKKLLCNLLRKKELEQVKDCLSHEGNLTKNGLAYLRSICNLMWYFYLIALEKGQNFTEGTFVIEDKSGLIYKYLHDYVKCVNPDLKGAAYAFQRSSSHFPLAQKTYDQYGIDTIPGLDLKLPTPNKNHILFGKIGDNKIFIKLESRGTGSQAISYLKGVLRKAPLQEYVKSYLPKYPEDQLSRTELLPSSFIEKCKSILGVTEPLENKPKTDKFSSNEEAMRFILYNLMTQGMQYLDKLVTVDAYQKYSNNLSEKQIRDLRMYSKTLQRQYDNIEMRYGREVIITDRELMDRCTGKGNKN